MPYVYSSPYFIVSRTEETPFSLPPDNQILNTIIFTLIFENSIIDREMRTMRTLVLLCIGVLVGNAFNLVPFFRCGLDCLKLDIQLP